MDRCFSDQPLTGEPGLGPENGKVGDWSIFWFTCCEPCRLTPVENMDLSP